MKTLDEMIAVMQAAKEGKEIEIKVPDDSGWHSAKCIKLSWNWDEIDYRIKPEEPKPEYVPYENVEEFFQGQNIHGVYFTNKARDTYYLPSCVSSHKNNIGVSGEGYYLTFASLLEKYIWQDGTPCGKLKE